ncbi:MAG TPA: DUF1549 domain-containing protein, partial [Gemmataceae bacterium]|nr:DUF1549 domain-containing protein [Gemmataceae bacterium]
MIPRHSFRLILALVASLLTHGSATAQAPRNATVEFNRDIRPILSNNCFVCHGPDKNLRKGDLRLDLEETAFADRGGYHLLIPGKPDKSELYRRISAKDAKERMPPVKHRTQLTQREIDLVRRWIEQGAKWQGHWSLIVPKRVALPPVADRSWPINAVDHFILAKLDEEKLKPSPEADRRTLLRRLSFDLTGLPPSAEAVDAFVADTSPKAYEQAIDRLLASPHYGERLTQYWLDVVRYADTGGYHSDNHRDVYLYRDWVIDAFNKNLPFDRFAIDQLAGDLVPNATAGQKIASGYNRLLQTTEEGGAQPKEYLAKYAADRVRNTATIWLGLTMGCAECHNHKFDPLTTKEFYSFAAFFADLKEKAVGRQDQTPLPTPTQAAELQRFDKRIADLQKTLSAPNPELDAAQTKWEASVRGKAPKGLPKDVIAALAVDPAKRNAKQQQAVTAYYRSIAPELREVSKQLANLQRQKQQITQSIPTTLVSMAVPPRTMRVLPR